MTDGALTLVLAVVALGPLVFERGYAIRGDMVFVPHQPWKDAWLGLDGSAPRFVPGDAVLSVATALVPGDLVQKLLLLGSLLLGGIGAGLLVRDLPFVARASAVVLFCWNPWVFERLSIGQWGSVVGYGCLPWVVRSAAAVRDDGVRRWPGLALWLALAAIWSPAAGLLAVLVAVCTNLGRPRLGPCATTGAAALLANLPWLVPSVVNGGQIGAPGPEFAGFASRAESGAGLLASVLSLGGIWKPGAVPGERTVSAVVLLSLVSTVVGLVCWQAARRGRGARARATVTGLSLVGLGCFLLALGPAVDPVTRALDRAVVHVPALGLVRDSDRFLGPAVLAVIPGVAWAAAALWRCARTGVGGLRLLAVLLAAWPVLCLPSMAWGLGGQLKPVPYPGEWSTVADLLADPGTHDLSSGATVVLPWRGSYRGFAWNDERAQLDPAPRYLPGEVLIDDRIYLGDDSDTVVLGNEEPRLATVTAALAAGDPASTALALRRIGVAHVLVEKANGVRAADVPTGRTVHDGPGLKLVDLGSAAGVDHSRATHPAVVVGADILTGLVVLLAAGGLIMPRVYGDLGHREREKDE